MFWITCDQFLMMLKQFKDSIKFKEQYKIQINN